MRKLFIFNHGGSGNHGCEALVRTVCQLICPDEKPLLLSQHPQEDIRYGIDEIAEVQADSTPAAKKDWAFLRAYVHLKRTGDYFPMDTLPYRGPVRRLDPDSAGLSIGGDVYCYKDYPKYMRIHEMICNRGCKTFLIGCSINKALFADQQFVRTLRRFSYISARESLTYHLLEEAGLEQIGLAPDSAFTLPMECAPLPDGFVAGNTVGLNVSPLVMEKESAPGIVMENYTQLIRHILAHTDCSVALIPHVIWPGNDDRTALRKLQQAVGPSPRVVMIADHSCLQLKGFIARCRFFIGARTHATIAAYSTGVPTLVLGYSIKSEGIAADLFGTAENYVLPVQDLRKPGDLTEAFQWLLAHEKEIRGRLSQEMPAYVARAAEIGQQVNQRR